MYGGLVQVERGLGREISELDTSSQVTRRLFGIARKELTPNKVRSDVQSKIDAIELLGP